MKQLKVIAGPCVIETEKMVLELAEKLKRNIDAYDIDFYFKASFDKANRTSISSYRGMGIEKGLKILEKAKRQFGVKIATDIHESYQANIVAEVADIIQIPAFLCRQTDLLVAAAKTGKCINVKKAQFLAPWDMKNVIKKIVDSGNKNILLCERGTSFGYNNLVVDMTGLVEMKKIGYPVIFDATHSVQKPGGKGDSTGGNRELVLPLARAAAAVGVDGFFMEVHPDPDTALSDGPNMIKLENFQNVLNQLVEINNLVNTFGE
ncbi:MAG: 3-deoxy-8-phosphooctulonate synthase [Lachnospiraceae bacterium]|nr:3-deoxy-8-phosphooctulonate synthase [Lachnospiraceae bacterium]